MQELSKLLATLIAVLGPAPRPMPRALQLKQGDKIVAIGDSITQFAGSPTGYLSDVDAILTLQYPELKIPKAVNAGISGQMAEDLVLRFGHDVVERKPAAVTINVGINDVWHRLDKPHDSRILALYSTNVAKMVDMAQAAGIRVIILTPSVIQEDPESEGNRRLAMYVDAEKKIAAEKNAMLVDLHQMFLDVLGKKSAGQKGDWLTIDGVHNGPRGDAIFAIGILRALGVPDEKIGAGSK